MGDDYSLEDQPSKLDGSRELQLHSIRQVMKTSNGRDFMWRCLQQAGTFGNTFDRDPTIHLINSGKREHGLWLQAELKQAAPEFFLMMLKEHEHEW